jgi:hypothetical protein
MRRRTANWWRDTVVVCLKRRCEVIWAHVDHGAQLGEREVAMPVDVDVLDHRPEQSARHGRWRDPSPSGVGSWLYHAGYEGAGAGRRYRWSPAPLKERAIYTKV